MKKLLLAFSFLLVGNPLVKGATFTSVVTGNYSNTATWSVVGADPDGLPDNNDDVIISTGTTVTLTATSNALTISVSPGGILNLNNKVMNTWGNFTNNGSVTSTGSLQFLGVGSLTGNSITVSGGVTFFSTYTIGSGMNLTVNGTIAISAGKTITNNGSILARNSATSMHLLSSAIWINANGSTLNVQGPINNSGTINCSAASNNFIYSSNFSTTILSTNITYYNLSLTSTSANTKSLAGNIVVLNNLTINSTVTLNWNNNNIALGGNWTNNANTTCTNINTITFNGSGTQTITRTAAERFNNVNFSGTGTVKFATNAVLNGTTNLNSGTLDPGAFIVHIKGATFNNNGGVVNTGATGMIEFDGTIAQTIGGTTGTTFGNVEFNSSVSTTLNISCGSNGTTLLQGGTFDIGAFNWTQSGATYDMAGGTNNSAAAGTIFFNGSSAQSITGASPTPFGNLTINGSSTVSLAVNITAAKNFSLLSGTFDVSASSFSLTVGGNFLHNGGTFNGRSGLVTLNGTSAQTISGTAATTFYDLTSSNTSGGVSQSSGLSVISDILTVNSQSFGTSGTGSIILPATASTTCAKIAPLGVGASLTGTAWTIQAYINGPATAYWQYLGSPVQSSTIADWDNDTRFYMSGVNGNDGNACCPTFYSVRTYNTASNTYSNITSTATALTPGRGFMVWMADNTTQLVSPLIFDTKGKPNFGNVTRAVTAGGSGAGYNLVSNPYACPVLFSSVAAASGNLGPNFVILQENGSYASNPNGGNIAGTQGFMCVATSTGNMTFTEACKNTAANPNIVREAAEMNMVRVRTTNDINGLGGEADIQFNNDAHDGFDLGPDMAFLPSPYELATNVWSTDADGKDLLCNSLDSRTDALNIPISVQVNVSGHQTISVAGIDGVTDYSCAWLEDLSNGNRINLGQADNYSFDGTAGDVHKFMLHFERSGDCSLSDQTIASSLESATQVYVSNDQLRAKFYFDDITNVQVNIYDAEGREVAAPEFFAVSNESVNLANPGAHGVYFVQIIKGDEVVTKKILY